MDPIRTLDHPLTDLWGLAAEKSWWSKAWGFIKDVAPIVIPGAGTILRASEGKFQPGKDLLDLTVPGANLGIDIAKREAVRKVHHEQDTAQAEAAQMQAEAEAAEAEAAKKAGQAKLAAKRRRGFASTVLFGTGMLTPAGGAGKTKVGE